MYTHTGYFLLIKNINQITYVPQRTSRLYAKTLAIFLTSGLLHCCWSRLVCSVRLKTTWYKRKYTFMFFRDWHVAFVSLYRRIVFLSSENTVLIERKSPNTFAFILGNVMGFVNGVWEYFSNSVFTIYSHERKKTRKKLTEKEVLVLNEPVFDLQKYTRNYFITIMWILFLFNSNNSIFIYPHRLSKYTPTLFRCYWNRSIYSTSRIRIEQHCNEIYAFKRWTLEPCTTV